jgi:hypothetical protein
VIKRPVKKRAYKVVGQPLKGGIMKQKNFTPSKSSAGGEIDCPKGFGRVKFSDSGFCPISGVQFCKDCDYKETPEKDLGTGELV